MTLDELAAMAMQGFLASGDVDMNELFAMEEVDLKGSLSSIAAFSYDLAEAMQAESRKRAEKRPLKNTVDMETDTCNSK